MDWTEFRFYVSDEEEDLEVDQYNARVWRSRLICHLLLPMCSMRVCALLIGYFSTVKVFFLLDSDLGSGQVCQYCALLSVPGPPTAHSNAGFWMFLSWKLKDNRHLYCVWVCKLCVLGEGTVDGVQSVAHKAEKFFTLILDRWKCLSQLWLPFLI